MEGKLEGSQEQKKKLFTVFQEEEEGKDPKEMQDTETQGLVG